MGLRRRLLGNRLKIIVQVRASRRSISLVIAA